jgi:TetR/AcrR family transcriptional repressor of nem operon
MATTTAPKQRSETAEQILDLAETLIQTRGYSAFSYQDIADSLGIRKASIHYYFATKEDLIEALLERYSAYFLALVDDIIRSKSKADQKLQRYVGIFEATLRDGSQDKACLCGMLGAELATLRSHSVRQVRSFYEANEARLLQILEEGRQDGSFRFEESARQTASLIFSLLEGAVLISRAQDGTPHFKGIGVQLLKLIRG